MQGLTRCSNWFVVSWTNICDVSVGELLHFSYGIYPGHQSIPDEEFWEYAFNTDDFFGDESALAEFVRGLESGVEDAAGNSHASLEAGLKLVNELIRAFADDPS